VTVQPIPLLPDWRHEAHETVGSTNALAMDRARSGDRGSLWVTAKSQSAGRGRRSSVWVSQPGNLHASLLLIDPAPLPAATTLPFVAGLAVHRAITRAIGTDRHIGLKWPNDVLLNGRKIAGILLESSPLPDDGVAIVIGCGVNCAHFPGKARHPATSLAHEGFRVDPEELFALLAQSMAEELQQWQKGDAFRSTRLRWLERASGLGRQITARLPDRECRGRFETIDQTGRLVLLQADGTRQFVSAGEVFFENATRALSAQMASLDGLDSALHQKTGQKA
jgi:BirA family biotin operon repressor/biotin-[acetyl-CoA-carboxylase] ligase